MTIALNNQEKPTNNRHSRLGVEVLEGRDITTLTTKEIKQLKQSLWQKGVVIIKRQNLKASQLREFALKTFGNRIFGKAAIEIDPEIDPNLQTPGVRILGNPKGLVAKDKIEQKKLNRKWHQDGNRLTDLETLEVNSLRAVMDYGAKIPLQGQKGYPQTTDFIDLLEAYNNLEYSIKRQLDRMYLNHDRPILPAAKTNQEECQEKIHPIVSTHKITGKKGLYLGEETATLVGMKHRQKEAKEFWQQLLTLILACTPVYTHVWQPGDVVLWDNSQVMHRSSFYEIGKSQHVALRVEVVDESDA